MHAWRQDMKKRERVSVGAAAKALLVLGRQAESDGRMMEAFTTLDQFIAGVALDRHMAKPKVNEP